ncbi:MAG: ABC transporter permease [Bacteroidales bacterium]
MLQVKRFFKTVLRYKTSTLLTLLSLVVAFLGIIVLTMYVSFERSFDKFHKNGASIYRLETLLYGSALPTVMGGIISEKVPEVESLVTLRSWNAEVSSKKQVEENVSFSSSLFYADSTFFDVFSFDLVLGDKQTALAEPFSIVIDEPLAEKVFGTVNVLGETLMLNGHPYTIKGVMKKFPRNSSFQTECLASQSTLKKNNWYGANDWAEWSSTIFAKLKSGCNPVDVAGKIESIPEVSEAVEELKSQFPDKAFVLLRPLSEIHYVSDWYADSVNPLVINVLALLAIILAVMGAVNFINFSTSQAPLRAKSLAILQVMGGNKFSSRAQVIAESMILSFVSMLIAFAIHFVVYSPIETFFHIKGLGFEGRGIFILWFILFSLVFGFIVGWYPSRYITSSPVVQSVKGRVHFAGKANVFRNILITIQFVFTIALLAAAITINKQLTYWHSFDIGINKEHVVYMKLSDDQKKSSQALADELMKNSSIVDYTYSSFIPGEVGMGWGRQVDGQFIQIKSWPVDDRFIDFFGIKILEGRKFEKDSKADVDNFIINKKAAEKFGWNNPLEKKINGFDFVGNILGVADNINFASLKEEVEPMLFWLTHSRNDVIMLRISPGNYTQTINFIKDVARKFDSKKDPEVKFLDDNLNTLYSKEERISYFIIFVAFWCMFLAITGLIGLVIFICKDRIKEIGVRKVNGATVPEIIMLVNRNFLLWLTIAFIIATPVAYYAMNEWLQNFAYKTALSWWIFGLSGIVTLLIEIFTVSWLSWRAARANPVETLRYE